MVRKKTTELVLVKGLGAGSRWHVDHDRTVQAAAVTKTIADVASNLSAVYLELGRAVIGSRWIKVDQGGHETF